MAPPAVDSDAHRIEGWPAAATSLERTLQSVKRALDAAQEELRHARGDYQTLRSIARRLGSDLASETVSARLSPQEWRVAWLAAGGRSDLELSLLLHLSVHTVKTHVKNVLRKLGLHSRWQLREALSMARTEVRAAGLPGAGLGDAEPPQQKL
jgi:DNA-binding NarL/FixJ family response regulator